LQRKEAAADPGECDVEVKAEWARQVHPLDGVWVGWWENEAHGKEAILYHCSKLANEILVGAPSNIATCQTIPNNIKLPHHLLKYLLIRKLNIPENLSTSVYCCHYLSFPSPPPMFSNIKYLFYWPAETQ